jgi:hypothetical protein
MISFFYSLFYSIADLLLKKKENTDFSSSCCYNTHWRSTMWVRGYMKLIHVTFLETTNNRKQGRILLFCLMMKNLFDTKIIKKIIVKNTGNYITQKMIFFSRELDFKLTLSIRKKKT